MAYTFRDEPGYRARLAPSTRPPYWTPYPIGFEAVTLAPAVVMRRPTHPWGRYTAPPGPADRRTGATSGRYAMPGLVPVPGVRRSPGFPVAPDQLGYVKPSGAVLGQWEDIAADYSLVEPLDVSFFYEPVPVEATPLPTWYQPEPSFFFPEEPSPFGFEPTFDTSWLDTLSAPSIEVTPLSDVAPSGPTGGTTGVDWSAVFTGTLTALQQAAQTTMALVPALTATGLLEPLQPAPAQLQTFRAPMPGETMISYQAAREAYYRGYGYAPPATPTTGFRWPSMVPAAGFFSQQNLPWILLGGGALLAVMFAQPKRRT